MMTKTSIVKIGNSQGVRIPKPLLEQSGLGEHVELEVGSNRITIRAADEPRRGWDEAFERMAAEGDDRLFDDEAQQPTTWDEAEWTWPKEHKGKERNGRPLRI